MRLELRGVLGFSEAGIEGNLCDSRLKAGEESLDSQLGGKSLDSQWRC